VEDKIVTRVLVAGGPGVLGREIVSRLLEKGYTVRVMSRSPQVQWSSNTIAVKQLTEIR
jgi:nucleoside-diphosphate-sugar epimerase